MLIYHATIIIHDIFQTNQADKNISDSSSYLDLFPLYGYRKEMQLKIGDDKFKLGFLKPDTFAENRLLRQPPRVCIMLVMYNHYHNYAATQLRRINENGRFQVPAMYSEPKLLPAADELIPANEEKGDFKNAYDEYETLGRNGASKGEKNLPTSTKMIRVPTKMKNPKLTSLSNKSFVHSSYRLRKRRERQKK